jgi:tRNA pseudouridine55 synthase
MISGIINVLKPSGITSNQVLTEIKKKLHPNKIGHLGTLDPSAVGVLPVCINKATKLFDLYLKKDKEYRAIFVFGKTTDTLDSDGKIIQFDDKIISKSDIQCILNKLIGKIDQMPPKYSAKNINGQRAYDLARKGIEFEVKPKQIEIYGIELVDEIQKNIFLFDIKCSSGTYIRSIVRDMANLLDTCGYMAGLIRTKSGNFDIENSVKLDDVTINDIIPIQKVMQDRQNVFVKDEFYDKITNGCEIKILNDDISNVVVYCKNQLIGIGNIKNNVLKINTYLKENQ